MHLRDDFPAVDDERWRRHITLRLPPHEREEGVIGKVERRERARLRRRRRAPPRSPRWPRTWPATATSPARCFSGDGLARVVAREAGVLSGAAAFAAAAALVDPALRVEFVVADGERVRGRRRRRHVRGPLAGDPRGGAHRPQLPRSPLGRRDAHGAATWPRRPAPTARIAATRKTTPGLRALEKQAVVHGGGTPHRFGLFDGAMIKDNHIAAAGGVRAAVALVRAGAAHVHALEVEVDTLEQLDEALDAGAAIVLLDNMDTPTVRAAVARVAGRALVEVSGGVRLERVRELAEAGVDMISVGRSHDARAWLDLGLDMEA